MLDILLVVVAVAPGMPEWVAVVLVVAVLVEIEASSETLGLQTLAAAVADLAILLDKWEIVALADQGL
jgi:hypothetical protein